MLFTTFRVTALSLLALLAAAPAALADAVPIDIGLLGRTPAGGEARAEIAAFDPTTQRAFATNADGNSLDAYDFSDPAAPGPLFSIDLSPWGAGPNSVAWSPRFGGILAVAVEADPIWHPGTVQVFDAEGARLASFLAGPLPDMVTFSDDGYRLIVANEGEPAEDGVGGFVDPDGSVTVIDLRLGLDDAVVRTAGFHGVPRRGPVRAFLPGSTAPQDLEPEYVTTAGDRAWVSLQEANAVGILDIEAGRFEEVRSLGFKDHGVAGNGIDATNDDDAPTIQTHPNVYGMYQPDAIAAYTLELTEQLTPAELDEAVAEAIREAMAATSTKQATKRAAKRAAKRARQRSRRAGAPPAARKQATRKASREAARRVKQRIRQRAADGVEPTRDVERTFVATANEGDARDFSFFSEEERAGDLTLAPDAFAAGAGDDDQLGRLNVTTTLGDTDGDGEYERLYAYGGRSMSLLDADGAMVFDTGDELEQLSVVLDPGNYNKTNEAGAGIDGRSDDKGPEPEAVATGEIDGRTYAFVGAERSGMIYAYDLAASPGEAEFAGWINTRQDDLGPEGIEFVTAEDSPTGAPMLLVTYEISGTVTAYELGPAAP